MPEESSIDSEPSPGDLTDKTLGDFRLLRRLGSGGMADVYLAEQLSLRRSVAVKILQGDAVSGKNDTLLKRFEQEARAAGGLTHPNIVQVYMTGHEGGHHFIVQEYVQGQNLSQWFKRNGPPAFLTGLKWMRQVAEALKAAAEAGVVHRDIKPENIMLTRAEDAKVTDFGLAQLNEPTKKMNLTQAGTTMGTPWYMSPEQIQGEPLDHRTDQYAFGVTCYHMFAGEPPFPGKNSVSVAVQHLKDEPAPLSNHRRDLPDALCGVIHRMMAKRPAERYATPEELLQAIDSLQNESVNPSVVDTTSVSGWLKSSMPSGKMLLGGLLLCGLLGAVAGRRLYAPTRLNPKPIEFQRETTAARQYAVAILKSSNQATARAAWEAVTSHYPGTDEALWARLQLGVHLLTRPKADCAGAEQAFQKLTQEASRQPESQKRALQFLAILGQTLSTDLQIRELQNVGDSVSASKPNDKKLADLQKRYDELVSNRLMSQYQKEMELGELEAPSALRDFYETLRIEADMQSEESGTAPD